MVLIHKGVFVSKKSLSTIFLATLFLSLQTFATTFRPMPLDKFIEEANRAAEVQLKSKKSFMNKMGLIFTEYTFTVNESYGIEANELDGEFLKITMTGGSANGVTSYIDGAPDFQVGEKSFLLLKKIESKIYLSNFTAGKYKISEADGDTYYISSVFPEDPELGKIKKAKMIEMVKLKFKITDMPQDQKVVNSDEKKYFQKSLVKEFEKRTPAQESFEERSSSDGIIAMWAFFGLFLCSGFTIWWKLKKGSSV
jgi:hypothetical protein